MINELKKCKTVADVRNFSRTYSSKDVVLTISSSDKINSKVLMTLFMSGWRVMEGNISNEKVELMLGFVD